MIKEASEKREGYDKTTVKGQIEFTDEYSCCPYCGGYQLMVYSCGHLAVRIQMRVCIDVNAGLQDRLEIILVKPS